MGGQANWAGGVETTGRRCINGREGAGKALRSVYTVLVHGQSTSGRQTTSKERAGVVDDAANVVVSDKEA